MASAHDNKARPLRILLVMPLYGGSLTVGRYCLHALRGMGHTVEVFDGPDFYPAFSGLKKLRVTTDRLDYLENSFLQLLSQAVLAKTETFHPDLVLAIAQAPLTRQALKRLKRDGVLTAMWFVEDFRLFTYWRAFGPWYDFFGVIQKEPFFTEMEKIGMTNYLYLPLAADPTFHRPLDLNSVERKMYGSDVSFLGAGYPNRRKIFQRLINYDLKIWGSDWEGDDVLTPFLQRGGTRIDPEEAVRIFNATRINLNLHSSVRSTTILAQGDFVNPRTFEVASCGGFQIVDERELMSELFDRDELCRIESIDQLKEKIDYYLAHPEERETLARKGRERVLADHTYVKRMETLLSFIDERTDGALAPAGTKADRMGNLPPELAAEVDQLLNRLGLSRETSFEDLVWSIRQQQGELSPVETAILFLDEWKKQYTKK